MAPEQTVEVADAEITRIFTAASFCIDKIRKETYRFLEIKRGAAEFTLFDGSIDGAREKNYVNTDPACECVCA